MRSIIKKYAQYLIYIKVYDAYNVIDKGARKDYPYIIIILA